jgi:enolase
VIIEDVQFRVVFDSRGNKTVEAEIFTTSSYGSAMAPSGASVGKDEAVVVDVSNLPEIGKKIRDELIGMDVSDQITIDEVLRNLDGTDNFSNIGGNFAIATSLAVAKAAADGFGLPLFTYLGGIYANQLPYPLGNVIGGGAHAMDSTDIQEFLIIPVGAESFFEAVQINSAVHQELKNIFKKKGIFAGKGDEGAWAASINDELAFELLSEAIDQVVESTGVDVRIGVDIAASSLWNGSEYVYRDKKLTPEEQIEHITNLAEKYELLYIEDPFHEDDFEGFVELNKRVKCMVCGDDLFVTNVKRIKKGIEMGAANSVLIKPNQIGTLTDTFKAISLAKENDYKIIVSHRSGETTDDTIAHLSVAFNAVLIKTGVVGGERIAKLNELIRIEEYLDHPRMIHI